MACSNSLPTAVIQNGKPLIMSRLLDSGCGCGAVVPTPGGSLGDGCTFCLYLLDGLGAEHGIEKVLYSPTLTLTYHIKVTSGLAGPFFVLSYFYGPGIVVVPTSSTTFTMTVSPYSGVSTTSILFAVAQSTIATDIGSGFTESACVRQFPLLAEISLTTLAAIIASIAGENACQPTI